jgi:F0F1-type ATP synthase membrane subunit c/vacuolar-type H+-ATPase subunit K
VQYANACWEAQFYLIGSVMGITTNHVGEKMASGATLMGTTAIGAISAGILVGHLLGSLIRRPQIFLLFSNSAQQGLCSASV